MWETFIGKSAAALHPRAMKEKTAQKRGKYENNNKRKICVTPDA